MKPHTPQDEAIRYCLWLGVDPHEHVMGYVNAQPCLKLRWLWYLGARVGQ